MNASELNATCYATAVPTPPLNAVCNGVYEPRAMCGVPLNATMACMSLDCLSTDEISGGEDTNAWETRELQLITLIWLCILAVFVLLALLMCVKHVVFSCRLTAHTEKVRETMQSLQSAKHARRSTHRSPDEQQTIVKMSIAFQHLSYWAPNGHRLLHNMTGYVRAPPPHAHFSLDTCEYPHA